MRASAVMSFPYCAFQEHTNSEAQKPTFLKRGSKGQGLRSVIGGFRSVLCVSLFQSSLLVIVIMIDGSEKHNCEGGF